MVFGKAHAATTETIGVNRKRSGSEQTQGRCNENTHSALTQLIPVQHQLAELDCERQGREYRTTDRRNSRRAKPGSPAGNIENNLCKP
jgi:hypothetical protein